MGGSILRTHGKSIGRRLLAYHGGGGPSTVLPALTKELPWELKFTTFCLPLGLASRTAGQGRDPFYSSWGEATRHLPLGCPRGLQTSAFAIAAFWGVFVYLAPGMRFGAFRSPLLGNCSPAPPRCVQPREEAGPFLRKSSLSKHWISFKKEAHMFSRTGFIVFVIVLYLFRSSSVKTLHTFTFPAARDVSSTLIQALYYFFPLRMVINCGSLHLLCWVQGTHLAYRGLKSTLLTL